MLLGDLYIVTELKVTIQPSLSTNLYYVARADMHPGTPSTLTSGLLTCIEPCLPYYKSYI